MSSKRRKLVLGIIVAAVILAMVLWVLGPLVFSFANWLSYTVPIPIKWAFPEFCIENDDCEYIEAATVSGGVVGKLARIDEEQEEYLNLLSKAWVKINWAEAVRNFIKGEDHDIKESNIVILFHMKDGETRKLYLDVNNPSFQRINDTYYYNNWYQCNLYPKKWFYGE